MAKRVFSAALVGCAALALAACNASKDGGAPGGALDDAEKASEALLKTGYPDGPYRLPDSLQGWRRELMGQALLDCLAAPEKP